MRKEILVFVKESYVRDAQAYIGQLIGVEDIYADTVEDNWKDASGAMLVAWFVDLDIEEAQLRICRLYPDADMNIFEFIPVAGR
ncbi:hypothetical protein AALA24_13660 [Anaerovoracaceae bacterium 42-11]